MDVLIFYAAHTTKEVGSCGALEFLFLSLLKGRLEQTVESTSGSSAKCASRLKQCLEASTTSCEKAVASGWLQLPCWHSLQPEVVLQDLLILEHHPGLQRLCSMIKRS